MGSGRRSRWYPFNWVTGLIFALFFVIQGASTVLALDSNPYHQLPAAEGKISYFASDDRTGVCEIAAFGEMLGERCGDTDATKYWYVAMRWPYNTLSGSELYQEKEWWHNKKILVTNPSNGKQVILAAKDWGPAEWTGRVIDVSKTALDALGTETDQVVKIEFADQNSEPGVVQCSKLSWDFNTQDDLEGWELHNVEDYSVESGRLFIDPALDPWVQSPSIMADAGSCNMVKFNMSGSASVNGGLEGTIYFTTADSPDYSEDKKVAFIVKTGPLWYSYRIYMAGHSRWNGQITGIRIDPINNGKGGTNEDTIGFDYIRVGHGNPKIPVQPAQERIEGIVNNLVNGLEKLLKDIMELFGS